MAPETPADATVPRHRLIVWSWLRRPAQRFILPDWLAITLGPLIFAWRPLDEVELAHELAHVLQWRRHGLMYIPRYFRASREAEKAGGDRYRDNVFEIEARVAEEEARRRRDEGG
jgi:hypothetical protein